MHGHLLRLINKTYAFDLTYRPNFFKLSDPLQKEKFQTLLNCEGLLVYDKIIDQVKELIKTRHPEKKLTIDEISLLAEKEFKGQTHDEFGVWVFYPWTNKLIHILDQPQFIELRTNRNLYKITIEERNRLSTKIVGVVGLSVGQSVALTMATERTFGEIRIADHDNLDLSNLNRIRSGLHNIGLSKVIITAREISEIDPFLKVTCFHEGIHSNNIDSFFLEGGKLDVLIEECDSVDIKILAREKAKKYGIPVIMEASDRGTVDIERFDLEKDRPIFHGNVINVSSEYLRGLSNEEKIPYILPIAGIDTLSPRMKASMMEVGKTIYTWPQLASAVVLGGAIAADIYRRIVLNQLQISGRFFIDLEELICDAPNDNFPFLNNILKKSTINNNFAKHSSLTIIESCICIVKNTSGL